MMKSMPFNTQPFIPARTIDPERTFVLIDSSDVYGGTFFICWITLPTDLKNWDFKKKKKGFCLTSLQNCLFLVSSRIIKKIIILKHYSALVNYVKNMIHGAYVFFFCDRESEKFQQM